MNAPIDEMLTMRPGSFAAINRLATSHDSRNGARTLVSSTASTRSTDIFVAKAASGTPALLTSTVVRPEPGLDGVDAGDDGVGVADVELDRQAVAPAVTDLGRQLLEPVDPAGGDRHGGAVLGEHDREAVAEAGAGARHQRHLARQVGRERGRGGCS